MDACLGKFVALDEERRKVTLFWAPLIVEANRLVAQHGLVNQRKYVLDRASWAVTEIEPGAETKLFRQRYWSFGALQWASQTFAATMGKSERGRRAASALRHEHVVSRRSLIQRLAACSDVNAVVEILASAVACVVTTMEAGSLTGEDNWSRYRRAGVQVYDRHLGREYSLGSPRNAITP